MSGRRVLVDPVARRGRASRVKGHSFERELVHRFREVWPETDEHGNPVVKRGIGQARTANEVPDVETPLFWVEAKRRKSSVNIGKAMRQAEEGAFESPGEYKIPIVVSKVDNKPALVTMGLEEFLELIGMFVRKE